MDWMWPFKHVIALLSGLLPKPKLVAVPVAMPFLVIALPAFKLDAELPAIDEIAAANLLNDAVGTFPILL